MLGEMEGPRHYLDGRVWLKIDVFICFDLKPCFNNYVLLIGLRLVKRNPIN